MLVDLGDLLPELPLGTAGAITLGLLASMYLDTGTGTTRIPPRSPIAKRLLSISYEPYGELPSQIIAKRLAGNEKKPLHIPLEPIIECRFETEAEISESDLIRSLKVSGVETLLPAQEEAALLLRQLVGGETATGAEILEHAAETFCLPTNKLDAGGDEASEYRIPEGMGFKAPKTTFRAKEAT